MSEIETLRKKYVNSALINKTCTKCLKEYPRTLKFFYPVKNLKKVHPGWTPTCITCENKRTNEWKRKNKVHRRIVGKKYAETEYGFFNQMFNAMKKSINYDSTEFPDTSSLIKHWHQQKKIHGKKCPATGVEMTMIKGQGKSTLTNISKDRILCFKPYTKQNLIFTTWKFNNDKSSTTPKMAKFILKITEERFGTDEIDI
tara:strand:- start:476 stop:1075 length:600 start_codon:yes stop_codon:yes gene_type:complete